MIYASLGKRVVAALLDALVLFIPCALAAHIIPVVGSLIVVFFYAPILESSEVKATLGKYWMGIQVTDLNGGQLTLRAAIVRSLLKFLSSALLCIGFFVALFNDKKQTLHDLLSESLVIYGRSDKPIDKAWVESVRALASKR